MKSIRYNAIASLLVGAISIQAMVNNNNNNQITGKKRLIETQEAQDFIQEKVDNINKCITDSLCHAIDYDLEKLRADDVVLKWFKQKAIKDYYVFDIIEDFITNNSHDIIEHVAGNSTLSEIGTQIVNDPNIWGSDKIRAEDIVKKSQYNEQYAKTLVAKIITNKTQFLHKKIAAKIDDEIENSHSSYEQTGLYAWFSNKFTADIINTYRNDNSDILHIEAFDEESKNYKNIITLTSRKDIITLTNEEIEALAPSSDSDDDDDAADE